jgi:hypothetical protein
MPGLLGCSPRQSAWSAAVASMTASPTPTSTLSWKGKGMDQPTDPLARQLPLSALTTEQFNLQTARMGTIAEANGRSTLYFGTLSSAVIALTLPVKAHAADHRGVVRRATCGHSQCWCASRPMPRRCASESECLGWRWSRTLNEGGRPAGAVRGVIGDPLHASAGRRLVAMRQCRALAFVADPQRCTGPIVRFSARTHQHCSPAGANCCQSLLLDPDATIGIDLHKWLFLLVIGRGE